MAENSGGEVQRFNLQAVKENSVSLKGEYFRKFGVVVSYKGQTLIQDDTGRFRVLNRQTFERLAYPMFGGMSRSALGDVYGYVKGTADDVSDLGHLILMGDKVWDTEEVGFKVVEGTKVIWRSDIVPVFGKRSEMVWELSGKNKGKYEDILQSIAPLFTDKKPTGVVWWIGSGANGKSALVNALHKIFPDQLANLTLETITDGRDAPILNAKMGNVVRESSEHYVEDTSKYKNIGAHEDFMVHQMYTQEMVRVDGNIHHIFGANNPPVFGDKNHSIRRRTVIIPFTETFKDDPTFEERTFTPEMLGVLLGEILRSAKELKERGYEYLFSEDTQDAKADLDVELNNAEEYARELVEEGVVAYTSFKELMADYTEWCDQRGYPALGKSNVRRVFQNLRFKRKTINYENKYALEDVTNFSGMVELKDRRGLWVLVGERAEQIRKDAYDLFKDIKDKDW